MGRTDRHGHRACFELQGKEPSPAGPRDVTERDDAWLDGAMSDDGLVWGTYIHGLFDEPLCRRAWLNRLRIRKGLPAADMALSQQVNRQRSGAMDRWADHVEQHLDLAPILALLRQGGTV